MLQQFFSRDQLADAANLIRRAGQQPRDVWFGVASFTAVLGANKQGQPEYRLERKQDDAQALRAFWYDADIHRPGDNKGPDKAFADEAELEQRQQEFLAVTRLPPPKPRPSTAGMAGTCIGFFIDAPPRDEWQPYAGAFKAALTAHGAKGDVGLTADRRGSCASQGHLDDGEVFPDLASARNSVTGATPKPEVETVEHKVEPISLVGGRRAR
jgi:hypothetical protein